MREVKGQQLVKVLSVREVKDQYGCENGHEVKGQQQVKIKPMQCRVLLLLA